MGEPIQFVKTSKKEGPVSITRPDTKERATCWSIVINNYTEKELELNIPGWKLKGQPEVGKNGTRHYQGMLLTPQVRFSQVKRQFPRANISIARDKVALAKYVQKEETRVGDYKEDNGIPTLWEYQTIVANEWDNDEFISRCANEPYARRYKYDNGTIALEYVDEICAKLIEGGSKGLEFVAINPMWRSAWKKFYASIITRHGRSRIHRQVPQVFEGGPEGSGCASGSTQVSGQESRSEGAEGAICEEGSVCSQQEGGN